MGIDSRRWIILGAALGLVALAARGLAQDTGHAAQDWSDARQALDRGKALFDVQNYDGALAEFLAAYQLLAGSPRQYIVLHNIAGCHERMFRYDRALHFYQRYLEQGGPAAEDRAAIERVVEMYDRLLANVHVHSNVVAEVWLDERWAGSSPSTLRVPPGKHLIEVRAPVYETARREVYVQAGANLELRIELNRLSQYRGLDPTYFWVGTSLTAAALIAGAAFGAHALVESNAEHERLRRDPFASSAEAERTVRTSATAADIAFAGAALFGVSSLVLFFLSDWEAGEGESNTQVTVGPGGSLAIRGQL